MLLAQHAGPPYVWGEMMEYLMVERTDASAPCTFKEGSQDLALVIHESCSAVPARESTYK